MTAPYRRKMEPEVTANVITLIVLLGGSTVFFAAGGMIGAGSFIVASAIYTLAGSANGRNRR